MPKHLIHLITNNSITQFDTLLTETQQKLRIRKEIYSALTRYLMRFGLLQGAEVR